MEIAVQDSIQELGFEEATHLRNQYMNVYFSKEKSCVIMEVTSSYIPTESFIDIFNKVGELVKQHGFEKMVFDKRAMRAFNQPTMEWYYVEWKEEMYKYGMKTYRKILPEEAWFNKCVEAGKAEILREYPNSKVHQLDMKYYDTIQQCVEN